MKIHEYQAKALFKAYGIAVEDGGLAVTPEEAKAIAQKMGARVAVKSQVHVGGRGKMGGIKLAADPAEAFDRASEILGMDIKGYTVSKVWIEKAANIAKEAYISIQLDRTGKSITFMGSSEGGMDIEAVAEETPEKILTASSTSWTFPGDDAKKMAGKLFDDESTAADVLDVMEKMFKLAKEKDCELIEINPLILTGDHKVVALDGKVNIDDNALFRQQDLLELRDMAQECEVEIEAKEKGLSFVQLDGDIGCMVNGAGLAMCTMDMISLFGGNPANFLDVGGSSSPEKIVHAFNYILKSGKVKAILINIFGGITRCDDVAKGILESYKQIDINVPVVIRLCGTNAIEGLALLEGSNLIGASSLIDGVKQTIALAK
jgi:succinyl-CoA synthetase beta subunit